MKTLRKYGQPPYSVAVIHGGPGAAGEMATVAKKLSKRHGVLEPLQREDSIAGQVQELFSVLKENADFPLTLIGFSWGAWLSFIFTSQCPTNVKKLILVSSGVFEEKYADDIMKVRLERLEEDERIKVKDLVKKLDDQSVEDKDQIMARFGELMNKADAYDPVPHSNQKIEINYEIHKKVWEQASEMRRTGQLLELGEKIKCPVVAIHGDYDPHSGAGVKEPLGRIIKDFRFISLPNCGHHPWQERQAQNRFYDILKKELI